MKISAVDEKKASSGIIWNSQSSALLLPILRPGMGLARG